MSDGTTPRAWLLKGAARAFALGAGFLVLLFPDLRGLGREVAALRDPQSMVNPDDPAVVKLSAEIDREIPPNLDTARTVAWVERWVTHRFPYANDWETWWNVDYWPTPGETVAKGREDCDGLAILTASLLRRRGIPARLEASIQHVWVAVDGQRILSPDDETHWDGDRMAFPGLRAVLDWFRYGLGEFPFWRWGLLAGWLVFALRWPARGRIVPELFVLLAALGVSMLAAKGGLHPFLFASTLCVCGGLGGWTLLRPVRTPEEIAENLARPEP